jgi:hypothetical protein
MPSARSAPQLPSAGDPSECTQFFSGLFNKLVADEAPALPPGGQHDDPELVWNEHVTEDKVCVMLRAWRSSCSSCDKIPSPVLWDLDKLHVTIPSFYEAQCVARLKDIYYSVFTSAGSDHPKMQKYHTCFAATCHPCTSNRDAQPCLRTVTLNTTKASFIARFGLSSHHLACETGTWRRRHGPAAVNQQGVFGAARRTRLWSKMNNMCFSHALTFRACGRKSPCSLLRTGSPPYGEFSMSTRLHMRALQKKQR